jgi:hypothetical protein
MGKWVKLLHIQVAFMGREASSHLQSFQPAEVPATRQDLMAALMLLLGEVISKSCVPSPLP